MNFLSVVDRVSHRGHLKAISVRGQLLSIVSEFLRDIEKRVRLDGKVSASVNVVLEVPQVSVLGPSLFILYTFDLFNIVGNHIVRYTVDTTIYASIPRPPSRPKGMELINHCLAAIDSLCLKWHMRLNVKKTKSMGVRRSWTKAPGCGDLTLGDAAIFLG